jgi:hypothetical protein
MTSFFGRIVERARSPIGTLRSAGGVARLELEGGEEDPALAAPAPALEPAPEAPSPPELRAAVDARAARGAPARQATPESAMAEVTPPDAAARREAPLAAAPFRDAGVRAVAPLPRPFAPAAAPAPLVPPAQSSLGQDQSPLIERLPSPVVDAVTTPPVTPELERRWRELGKRLLHAHPPERLDPDKRAGGLAAGGERHAPAFGEPALRAPAPSVPPNAAPDEAHAARSKPGALPEARFVAARPEPRATPRAAGNVEASAKSPSDLVIQNLEVTVAAPRPEPEPRPHRSLPTQRGGAWNVVARRYLTRI